MQMKIALLLLLASSFSCGLLFEKHESPWFFEWRLYDAKTNSVMANSSLAYRFEIRNNVDYFRNLFEDTVENNGYIFISSYSDYEQDFLSRNPSIIFKVFKDSITIIDTTLYWKNLVFSRQKLDTVQHEPGSTFYYDTLSAYNNVNKMRFYIHYP
jgi:hypothetical protein